jgi:hypothetical protein
MQKGRRTKIRAIHMAVHTVGISFIILGVLFIVGHKAEFGHSLLPSTWHSIMGSIALCLILCQFIMGHTKLQELESKPGEK